MENRPTDFERSLKLEATKSMEALCEEWYLVATVVAAKPDAGFNPKSTQCKGTSWPLSFGPGCMAFLDENNVMLPSSRCMQ